jgi:hypothetical protein
MSRHQKAILIGVAALVAAAVWTRPVSAAVDVAVTSNSTTNFPGITAWPSPPTIDTTALAPNPGAFITVTEGNLAIRLKA